MTTTPKEENKKPKRTLKPQEHQTPPSPLISLTSPRAAPFEEFHSFFQQLNEIKPFTPTLEGKEDDSGLDSPSRELDLAFEAAEVDAEEEQFQDKLFQLEREVIALQEQNAFARAETQDLYNQQQNLELRIQRYLKQKQHLISQQFLLREYLEQQISARTTQIALKDTREDSTALKAKLDQVENTLQEEEQRYIQLRQQVVQDEAELVQMKTELVDYQMQLDDLRLSFEHALLERTSYHTKLAQSHQPQRTTLDRELV